jgi:SAM-dependent methyltransferase
MNVEKEVQFFDAFEAQYGEYDVLTEKGYQRILDLMDRYLPLQPGRSCVDLGCGTGAFTRRLKKFDLVLTGVDISPRSIERARTVPGVNYVVGDICDCPLPSGSFDLAVMSGVLHHLPTREVRHRSLKEALRLLKPGGNFFSYDPNGRSPSMFFFRDPRSPFYSTEGKTDNEILFTRIDLLRELAAAGFEHISVRGVSGITYRYVAGRFASKVLPLYNHVYEPLIRWSPLQNLLGTFLVVTAKAPQRA